MKWAYYNEIDPYCAQWLRNLMREGLIMEGEVDERSIQDVAAADVDGYIQCHFFAGLAGWGYALQLANWPEDRPIWTGSCPCQPFSVAGKRKGTEDSRHLWPEFYRLIVECLPECVIGEQVASKDGREWLAGVQVDLEALGLEFGAADLCAAGVRSPHIRQRLYWVAQSRREREERGLLGPAEGIDTTSKWASDPLIGSGSAVRLVQPIGTGLEGYAGHGDNGHQPGWIGKDEGGSVAETGAVGRLVLSYSTGREQGRQTSQILGYGNSTESASNTGFWSDFDILHCLDNKARRVERGTFPLADGSAFSLDSGSSLAGKSRTGILRGFGNAIVSPLAAEFVKAYMSI